MRIRSAKRMLAIVLSLCLITGDSLGISRAAVPDGAEQLSENKTISDNEVIQPGMEEGQSDAGVTRPGTEESKPDSEATQPDMEGSPSDNEVTQPGEDADQTVSGGESRIMTADEGPELQAVKEIQNVTVKGIANATYTGKPITQKLKVTDGKTVLKENADYTVSYLDNTDAGEATVTLSGLGNYTGTKELHFTIAPKKLTAVKLKVPALKYFEGTDVILDERELILTDGATQLLAGTDYLVNYENNQAPGKATVTVTGQNNYTGKLTAAFNIRISMTDIMVSNVEQAVPYTGKAYKPLPVLTDEAGYVLQKDKDYTVSYASNINAGTATITLTGKGMYEGKATECFTITPLEINEDTVTVTGIRDQDYVPGLKDPGITVKMGKTVLKKDRDYDLSILKMENFEDEKIAMTATVTITGKGNYTGTINSLQYNIMARPLEKCKIAPIPVTPYQQSGLGTTPDIVITDGKTRLSENTSYKCTYENNYAAGTATVTITGMNCYYGTITRTFEIKKNIAYTIVEGLESTVEYTGAALTQNITLTDKFEEGKLLILNKDYTVSYKNNKNAGEATLTITGKGEYMGTQVLSFTVAPRNLEDGNGSIAAIKDVEYKDKYYKPAPVVYYGKTKLKKADYSVEYSDNWKAGVATVTVTGKGNYTGVITTNFQIKPRAISKCTLSADPAPLSAETGEAVPVVSVYDKSSYSRWLWKGRDYTVTYENNTTYGTGKVTFTGIGNYTGSVSKTFAIKKDITAATVTGVEDVEYTGKPQKPEPVVTLDGIVLKKGKDYTVNYDFNVEGLDIGEDNGAGAAYCQITGKGAYAGFIEKEFLIQWISMQDAKITISAIPDQTYTGQEIKPKVKVTYKGKALKDEKDYDCFYYKNVNTGRARVRVWGDDGYKDYVDVYFNIQPKKLTKAKIAAIPPQTFDPLGAIPALTVTDGKTVLQEGTDYLVTGQNNRSVGTATAIITGTGNYTGTIKKTFKIMQRELEDIRITEMDAVNYEGKPCMPKPELYLKTEQGESRLVEKRDYTCVYKNNTGQGTATIVITGCGNYTGVREITFVIR